jgi:hypothetical protein
VKQMWMAFVCSVYVVRALGEECDDTASRLASIDFAKGVELQATTDATFTKLFEECDERNTFAKAALPTFKGKPLRCSTDLNRVERVLRFPDKTVMFTAKASVDADGSPVSCGPNRSLTDQCRTWLTFDKDSATRYVDAEKVPFIVVPGDFPEKQVSFTKSVGVGRGDLAVVIYKGHCAFGVVGDSGPYFRLGEISIAAHEALGNPQCATTRRPCPKLIGNGSGRGIEYGVTYLIFPGSRPKPLTAQNVVEVARANARKYLDYFLSSNAPNK